MGHIWELTGESMSLNVDFNLKHGEWPATQPPHSPCMYKLIQPYEPEKGKKQISELPHYMEHAGNAELHAYVAQLAPTDIPDMFRILAAGTKRPSHDRGGHSVPAASSDGMKKFNFLSADPFESPYHFFLVRVYESE